MKNSENEKFPSQTPKNNCLQMEFFGENTFDHLLFFFPLLCHFIASLERHENPIKGDIESRPTSKKAEKEEKSFPAEEILEYSIHTII